MADQNEQWDSYDDSDSQYLDKSHYQQPKITQIADFIRMESFSQPNVLHVAFADTLKWTTCTKPMQKALAELFPGQSPATLVGKTVMVGANQTAARAGFAAGWQLYISPPPAGAPPAVAGSATHAGTPQQQHEPVPPAATAPAPTAPAQPAAPAPGPQEGDIAF